MTLSAPNTIHPTSNADLHGLVMRTRDGHVTGPLYWVPERQTWTDPQRSDEWKADGSSQLYPGDGDLAGVVPDVGPEPMTAVTALEAVNLGDAVRDAHWSRPVTTPRHLDAVAIAEQVQ